MVEVDWVIGFSVFLIFVVWAFTYYTFLFNREREPLEEIAVSITNQIAGSLEDEVVLLRMTYTAQAATPSATLFINYTWPFGKETTRLFDDEGNDLNCRFGEEGDTVFFSYDIESGDNVLFMEYNSSDYAGTAPCDPQGSPVLDSSTKKPILGVEETVRRVSLLTLEEMNSMGYGEFKALLALNRDFRIEFDTGAVLPFTEIASETGARRYAFGPDPPETSVFANERHLLIREGAGPEAEDVPLTVRVLVW